MTMSITFETILSSIEKSLQHSLPAESNPAWIRNTFRELKPAVTDEHIQNLINHAEVLWILVENAGGRCSWF